MAVWRINNFGGEAPCVPPRDLQPNGAQVNSNLLATAVEFRPTQGHMTVTTNPGPLPRPGAIDIGDSGRIGNIKNLYRSLRGSDGKFHTDDGADWFVFDRAMHTVRGQLAGDSTERSYVSYDDGKPAPRVFTTGTIRDSAQSYKLGVPKPDAPIVFVTGKRVFTASDAEKWYSDTLLPAYVGAIKGALSSIRWATGATRPYAGGLTYDTIWQRPLEPNSQRSLSGKPVSESGNLLLAIPQAMALRCGLNDSRLGGVWNIGTGSDTAMYYWVSIRAIPEFGKLDQVELKAKFKAIMNPRIVNERGEFTTPFYDDAKCTSMANDIAAYLFSPEEAEVLALRKLLDLEIMDYGSAFVQLTLERAKYDNAAPAKPGDYESPPEHYIWNGGEVNENPAWTQWRARADAYDVALSEYNASIAGFNAFTATSITAMLKAAEKAAEITDKIEALYKARVDGLTDLVLSWKDQYGLLKTADNPNGLIEADSDRMTSTRFYVCTFVTAWGWESAPSDPSQMLEVDQYNSVNIYRQSVIPDDHNITKWRIYRSSEGSQAASFRLVCELDITYMSTPTRTPIRDALARTGWENKLYWTDDLASWVIAHDTAPWDYPFDSKIPSTTAHLMPGDSVLLTNPNGTIAGDKTWNGQIWQYMPIPLNMGSNVFVDTKLDDQLETDLLTTTGWNMPPSRPDPAGGTVYLQGLCNLPGGVMAGFVDNFVALCEPNYPYAWREEIPLDTPIVGLGAFGYSLFAGTLAHPYVITDGRPQKMGDEYACVSARSIASADNGVFYASKEGYCFCNESGVKLITGGLFAAEDWALLNPASIFAVMQGGVLYFWFEYKPGFPGANPAEDFGIGCYGLDFAAGKLTRHSIPITAVFEDQISQAVYGAGCGKVSKLFAQGRAVGRWFSKRETLPAYTSYSWLQVWGDQSDSAPATVTWWVDGAEKYTVDVKSTKPVRLPPGRYRDHSVEIVSQARITEVLLASSHDELQVA